jgi:hypothetical protein
VWLLLGLLAAAVATLVAFVVWSFGVLATGQVDDLGAGFGRELFQLRPAEPYLEQLQVEAFDSNDGEARLTCTPAGATPAPDKDFAHEAPFRPDLIEPVRLIVDSVGQMPGSTIL